MYIKGIVQRFCGAQWMYGNKSISIKCIIVSKKYIGDVVLVILYLFMIIVVRKLIFLESVKFSIFLPKI